MKCLECGLSWEPLRGAGNQQMPACPVCRLREVVVGLRRELKEQHIAGRVRNLALDSLHYVWCNGGCEGGVHRFDHRAPLTNEIVTEAERNVSRMRAWLTNHRYRIAYRAALGRGLAHEDALRAAHEEISKPEPKETP